MSFCNQNGIPHSKFLEWDPDDRSKALAYLYEEGTKCGMCGTADWEWEQQDETGAIKPVRAYEPVDNFCMGCYLKSIAGEDQGNQPGLSIRLVPRDSVEAARNLVAQRKAWEGRDE